MSSRSLLALSPVRGFAADRRFSTGIEAAGLLEPQVDPLEQAFARGHAEGCAQALVIADQRAAEAEAARDRIEFALARIDETSAVELREKLRQTVLALCEEAVAPLAIDPDGLCRRVERAVAMLQRKQDARLLRLHPDDLALVEQRLPAGLAFEPDPSLERGALRIDTPDGGVEDGPKQWRAILAEAFREC